MRARQWLAVAVSTICAGVIGVAAPAASAAVVAAPAVTGLMGVMGVTGVTLPACTIASPENITGAMLVNNQIVNGTWHYSTGVACTANIGDIALYQELDHNGIKVDSKLKGFTGAARELDAITSNVPCAVCNGTWVFKWGQILKALPGFMFTSPPAGCVLLQSGLYQLCVQTKTVVI